MKILLVEDDTMIGESISHALKGIGYGVDWVQDGITAEESINLQQYTMILLDLGLPKQSGIELLGKLRKKENHIPVLIISARDKLSDKIYGLDSGADDYLIKPFELSELEARIRAILRRQGGKANPIIKYGKLELNPATKEIKFNNKKAQLSAREFSLMSILIEHPGKIFSRPELEEKIYGWNEEVESNSIEVHIHALRKKLGSGIIQNIRGLGYKVGKE